MTDPIQFIADDVVRTAKLHDREAVPRIHWDRVLVWTVLVPVIVVGGFALVYWVFKKVIG